MVYNHKRYFFETVSIDTPLTLENVSTYITPDSKCFNKKNLC